MPDGRICCALGVCCEPPHQAVALANHLNIPLEAAQAIAGTSKEDGHVLIPRTIPAAQESAGDDGTQAFAEAGRLRLERLHRLVQSEMKAIFIDLGHSVEAKD